MPRMVPKARRARRVQRRFNAVADCELYQPKWAATSCRCRSSMAPPTRGNRCDLEALATVAHRHRMRLRAVLLASQGPTLALGEGLDEYRQIRIGGLAVRDADAHHVALFEASERYPRAAGLEHALDNRAWTPERRWRDSRQYRERRIVDDRPSVGLESLADSRGLRNRPFNMSRVTRPSRRGERDKQP